MSASAEALREDAEALARALEFLRRHDLVESERALEKELSARGVFGAEDGDRARERSARESEDADDDDGRRSGSDSDGKDEEDEDVSWKQSTLRRLRSVDVSGRAMYSSALELTAPEQPVRHARRLSSIELYDEVTGTETHEAVLEAWRKGGEVNCEYDEEDDEGFTRYSVPRHEFERYILDSFADFAHVSGEHSAEERTSTDGHVQFTSEVAGNSTHSEAKILDRPGSFTFSKPSEEEIINGNSTPIPAGCIDPTRDAFEAFHLKVYHRPNKTGFEESKEFVVKCGDVIANRYKIEEGIGCAAFSKTVRAQDLQTGKAVCLKIVKNNKDFVDQSLDEIKLLQLLNHADPTDDHGILRMTDFFYFKEHLFIVSELLRANLYEFQKYDMETSETSYFSLRRVQCVAKQILKSLAFVHERDLIHCDLKPENILIKSYADCTVKLIDFGSSCFTTDVMGTYAQSRAYRAPEVIIGAKYSQKVDIWSLGCILAEIYSGHVLFRNTSVPSLLARMVSIRGPFDPKFLAKGAQSHKYFTKQGFLYDLEEMSGSVSIYRPKRTCLKKRIGSDDEDFIDFLEELLQVDPDKRVSATEALNHPWLAKTYHE